MRDEAACRLVMERAEESFGQHGRLIFAPRPVQLDRARVRLPKADEKPEGGVWYACGLGWLQFLLTAYGEPRYAPWVYAVEVDLPSMLTLETPGDVRRFSHDFGVEQRRSGAYHAVDWPRVAELWSGVEICPYQPSLRMRRPGVPPEAFPDWYHAWDVASGAVWDLSAIMSIAEVGRP